MSDDPKSPLPYERSATSGSLLTRGQFRWLMLILGIHLLVTLQTTYAPAIQTSVKQWWTDRQQAKAHAATVQQKMAAQQQVMDFVEPPNKVIWEEDPEAASKLIAGAGYRWIIASPLDEKNRGGGGGLRFGGGSSAWFRNSPRAFADLNQNFPRGAFSLPPGVISPTGPMADAINQFFTSQGAEVDLDDPTVFLHQRRSPSGKERIVWVYMWGSYSLGTTSPDGTSLGLPDNAEADKPFTASLLKQRLLTAVLWTPGNGEKLAELLYDRRTAIDLEIDDEAGGTTWSWTPRSANTPGKVRLSTSNRLRVFAGQPDPSDASHFTIAYDMDGKPGKIDGRVKDDDIIELRPSTGKTAGNTWDLRGQ